MPRDDANSSGIVPIEYRCLVRPDEVESKTKGGILLPDQHRAQAQMAQVQGELVAMGELACTVDGTPWPDRPRIGDRVMIARYAGLEADGADGRKYRVINDRDIAAVLR